jgi:hypothetical protein
VPERQQADVADQQIECAREQREAHHLHHEDRVHQQRRHREQHHHHDERGALVAHAIATVGGDGDR